RLPRAVVPSLRAAAHLRYLRTCALTDAYAELFAAATKEVHDSWAGGIDYPGRPALGDVGPEWTPERPLRRDSDRRQALLEIDAILALSLGITADEVCTVDRTQFAVLYGYDRNSYYYDANGRLVPKDVLKLFKQKGENITEEERTAVHPGSG